MVTTLQSGGGAGSALPTSLLICCGAAVAFATVMSLASVYLHLKNYRKPLLQRMVVRILIMVPIYGISSLIAIFSLDAAFVIDAIRDVYEAFVIYCFFSLLLGYLGGERSVLILLHGRPPKAPVFPLNLFWHEIDVSDPYTFLFLKRGILQYVQIKPILAVATLIMKGFGVYNEGNFRANSGYLYVTIVYNFSIFLALYCLAMFWVVVHDDLQPFRPMPKFICIKGIIFFSFWQAALISLLVALKAITRIGPYTDSEHISLALTDTLICFEMIGFAILHQYAFSQNDYIDKRSSYAARMTFGYAVRDAFGVRDVLEDTKATLSGGGMDYKEFEPAEGFMHQGAARERRIKAGLRYAQGGKKKYWLPMPAQDSEPQRAATRVGQALPHDENEEVYAPLLEDQLDDILHDAPDLAGQSSDEDDVLQGVTRRDGDGYSLYFGTPNNSEENLYGQSKHYLFGDYKYPVIDVSHESARQRIWDEEERILTDARGAFFSPRHEERRLYFAKQRDYGTADGRPTRSRGDSFNSTQSQTKGKKRVEGGTPRVSADVHDNRELAVNYEDDRLPDLVADGVKLKWTRHGNLRPSVATGRDKSASSSVSPHPPSPLKGRDERPTPISRASSSGSAGGSAQNSPRARTSSLTKTPIATQNPDAVDLVVEDPKAAEEAMARERQRGEPAVRGSGLRKVYRQQYVIEDSDGSEKEVEVEERRDPQRTADSEVADMTDVKIRRVSESQSGIQSPSLGVMSPTTTGPTVMETTEIQVAREESPPPFAKMRVNRYETVDGDEDHNPWA